MELNSDEALEALIGLLESQHATSRMLAMHYLSESYAEDPRILTRFFSGWGQWGADAFPEFPMLSFVPIPEDQIAESCRWASEQALGKKIIAPESRCAGKLVEQLMRLPAQSLREHRARIGQTKEVSKIFFRVDLNVLDERFELLDCRADQVAAVLDDAIATLIKEPEHSSASSRGIIALEALRRHHPDYIDLNMIFKNEVGADGPSSSFRVALQSLISFPQLGSEQHLSRHLLNPHESVYCNIVEALVRCGSREAAEVLLEQLEHAEPENQKWIARGLQRLKLPGLASGIAAARDATKDPYLWLMLLIAEVRQFRIDSVDRIRFDLERLQSTSEALIDSLTVFLQAFHDSPNMEAFRRVANAYINRAHGSSSTRPNDGK